MPREVKPRWTKDTYTYYNLAYKKAEHEVRTEYNKLYREANRRLQALSRSKNETAQRMVREYADIVAAQPKNKNQLVKSTIALERFISSNYSKVTNIYAAQRKTLESLQSSGYSFISKKNLSDFGRFMEYMRNAHGMRRGGSGSVMEFLTERGKVGSNPGKLYEAFEKWAEENDKEI